MANAKAGEWIRMIGRARVMASMILSSMIVTRRLSEAARARHEKPLRDFPNLFLFPP